MDYLDYEGISDPPVGQHGAALVWGNVLVRSGPFRWVQDATGMLLLEMEDLDGPTICPHARLREIQLNRIPQYGKYEWLLDQVVVEAIQCADSDQETSLRNLFSGDGPGTFASDIRNSLEKLGVIPPSKR